MFIIDIPASHSIVKGKPKEAYVAYAPKLFECLIQYFGLKCVDHTALFLTSEQRNID